MLITLLTKRVHESPSVYQNKHCNLPVICGITMHARWHSAKYQRVLVLLHTAKPSQTHYIYHCTHQLTSQSLPSWLTITSRQREGEKYLIFTIKLTTRAYNFWITWIDLIVKNTQAPIHLIMQQEQKKEKNKLEELYLLIFSQVQTFNYHYIPTSSLFFLSLSLSVNPSKYSEALLVRWGFFFSH